MAVTTMPDTKAAVEAGCGARAQDIFTVLNLCASLTVGIIIINNYVY